MSGDDADALECRGPWIAFGGQLFQEAAMRTVHSTLRPKRQRAIKHPGANLAEGEIVFWQVLTPLGGARIVRTPPSFQ
ncbi:hypothetical protein U91I_01470 [alpha proteobacterium U9-1i]|nr:hypothetical protein U91I_01470 [alpha proteobacterium U9-1i]